MTGSLSCSADRVPSTRRQGSIGSVYGLRQPQTTIDALTLSTIIDVSAPMYEGEALPIKKVNIYRSFGPSMVYRSGVSNLPSSGPPRLRTASGREWKDKAALSLGAGETLILARLRAFSGPSASGSSPSSTPTTTPDRAAKHARPLVDARPGGEARQHDRALVDAGRTEFEVGGIGSSIMHAHPPTPLRSRDTTDGRPRTNASFADARSHRQGPKSLPHTTDNTPDSPEAPQPSSSSVLNESDHLKSPGIIPGAVSVEPVHRDLSHMISDRTDGVAKADGRRRPDTQPATISARRRGRPQPYESHQQGYVAA
ncbi:hypothetical protein THAOC_19694 [Thalassiosira oceanica]|uniref:Uncharacterized protein n=1 Tax=Thalassiosira oceanica TaxID=159749 RepID=K0SNK2_THAOC|nr:hypothetical protein THAOC_19694 [Thalassiosira oceanica]|eukprot:EJK60022.1 hypothetical protein THAOC_19694 [Thalassiosira oceanica]